MYDEPISETKEDIFMKKFKYYKSNKPKPSLRAVISIEKSSVEIANITPSEVIGDVRTEALGLKSCKEWQCYSFKTHPGLIFISNPFTNLGQRYWIRKCLEEYPRKPNKLNIDVDINIDDWWQTCYKDGQCNRQLQKKLRWTTLGYHHNWDTKVYTELNQSRFPEDLAELSDVVAQYLGYNSFKAEAAIVNYYHMSSTLSAHTDHSEVNLEAPLFSFSFGQSAIFMIGGQTKTVEPSALLLNSGDIVVMSKEARLCYHAVPRILPSTKHPWNDHNFRIPYEIPTFKYINDPKYLMTSMAENTDNSKWSKFDNYIKESRINMNVRQVLKENQKSL
ncbi:hypothetical protein K1T71_008304 [Dendrolimus kikuchii]|uniref:Uncharacterized protein n=1 Tax=Dendrolimus kikuchii TaxID=765133 RepID=A0ACC1CWW5_9NEOP|nr:hypothetical protein K1T71_008304 [Dendrolimus kikuchii]